MVDAITERSGFLSVQPRTSQRGGEGAQADSAPVTSLPVIQFSPTRVSFDNELNRVFFQFRDSDTGEVTRETPPRTASLAFEAVAASTGEQTRASIFNFDDNETPASFPVAGDTGVTGTAEASESADVQPTSTEATAAAPATGSARQTSSADENAAPVIRSTSA